MTGYIVNNRGRYKCKFCNHPTYKTMTGVSVHIEQKHELEMAKATADGLREEITRLRKQPPKVVYKDREKPDPKYWFTGVYCSVCKVAYESVGIPFGQTIESTPHSNCGTKSLMLVNKVVL